MTTRRLLLLDVDGVLAEPGEPRRLPGAAETLAKLRIAGDTELSLLTRQDEASARKRIVATGLDRYLDFSVATYGENASATEATKKARDFYTEDLAVVVVTADPTLVAAGRTGADMVIAVAVSGRDTPDGADHVVGGIAEIVPLLGHVHTR